MKEMTIANMPVNLKKQLNNETKKNLVKIIETEFTNQTTQFNNENREIKEKILESYRQKVGFDELIAEKERLDREKKKIDEKIQDLGLDGDGSITSSYRAANSKAKEAIKRLENMIESKIMKDPMTLKNKIITRLLLSDTYGEALVVIKEVLGNGIIPPVFQGQLLEIKENE